jgi:hypothetical protein
MPFYPFFFYPGLCVPTTTRYAYFKKLDYFSTECIYSPDAYRGHARAFLKDLEAARPSAIIDIIHSGEAFEVKDEVRAMQKLQRMYLSLSFPSPVTDAAIPGTQRNANVAVTCPAMTSARPALCSRASSAGCRPLPSYAIPCLLCIFLRSHFPPHRVTRAAGSWRRKGQRQTTSEQYPTSTQQLQLRLMFQ